jgi:hypothetical protein
LNISVVVTSGITDLSLHRKILPAAGDSYSLILPATAVKCKMLDFPDSRIQYREKRGALHGKGTVY